MSKARLRISDLGSKQSVDLSEHTCCVTLHNDRQSAVTVWIEERIAKRLIDNGIKSSYQPGQVFEIGAGECSVLELSWLDEKCDNLRLGLPLKVKEGLRSMPMQIDLVGSRKPKPAATKQKKRRPLVFAQQSLTNENEAFEHATSSAVKRSLSTDLKPTQSPRRETYVVGKKSSEANRVLFQCTVQDVDADKAGPADVDRCSLIGDGKSFVSGDCFNSTVVSTGLDMQHALKDQLVFSTITKKTRTVNIRNASSDLHNDDTSTMLDNDANGTIINYLATSSDTTVKRSDVGGCGTGLNGNRIGSGPPKLPNCTYDVRNSLAGPAFDTTTFMDISPGTGATEQMQEQKRQIMLQRIFVASRGNDENQRPTPRVPRTNSKNRSSIKTRKLSPVTNLAQQSRMEGAGIESWEREQLEGLTKWLNVVLKKANWSQNPDDQSWKSLGANVLSTLSKGIKQEVTVSPNVGKEARSMRHYSNIDNLNALRRKANLFYRSTIVPMVGPLENAVNTGKIAMHTEKKLHADTGIQRSVLRLLLGVNPLWLRIGLECVYSQLIDVGEPANTKPLAEFIATRVVVDPLISAQYGHADVRSVMKSKEGELAQGKAFLKRIIPLFMFLDQAKMAKLIPGDPCLFRANADQDCKSTVDILNKLNKEVLSASSGDLVRTLGRIGYKPTYKQNYLHEFNYRVTHLYNDLKDGIRLVKVVELMTGFNSLDSQLLFPPTSLTQMQHNVKVALDNLNRAGCDTTGIDPGHVNIPNREKILDLLWRIVFHFQIVQAVRMESLVGAVAKLRAGAEPTNREYSHMIKMCSSPKYMQKPLVHMIFEWARLTANKHGVQMTDFERSLTDGCVLQALVLEHAPCLLDGKQLHWDSRDVPHEVAESGVLIKHELYRCQAVFDAVRELGVTPLVRPPDANQRMRTEPRMMILFMSLLAGKLLDLQQKQAIGLRIVTVYRQKKIKEIERIRLLKQTSSATRIQRFWRGRGKWTIYVKQWVQAARKQKEIMRNIVFVQATWRMILARNAYVRGSAERRKRRQAAAVLLQAHYRGWSDRRRIAVQHAAARRIQSGYKAHVTGKRQRRAFLDLKDKTVLTQAAWRGFLVRRDLNGRKISATKIQAHYRGWRARRMIAVQHAAARRIQSGYKAYVTGNLQRRAFLDLKDKTVLTQAAWRGFRVRRDLNRQKIAATKIQARFKGSVQKRRYSELRAANSVLQRAVRRWLAKRRMQRRRTIFAQMQALSRGLLVRCAIKGEVGAATAVQFWYRAHTARRTARAQYLRLKWAATVIQTRYRARGVMNTSRAQYLQLKAVAVLVQCNARRLIVQRRVRRWNGCATLLQARIRGCLGRRRHTRQKCAAGSIQTHWRAHVLAKRQRTEYLHDRKCVITVQAVVRRFLCMRWYKKQVADIELLQSFGRALLVRRQYIQMKSAVLFVQREYRAKLHRIAFQRTRAWITQLQSLCRARLVRTEYIIQVERIVQLQSLGRGAVVRQNFKRQQLAACKIQSAYRAYKQGKQDRDAYVRLKDTVIALQSLCRRKFAKDAHETCKERIVTLHAACRGFVVRQRIGRERAAASRIQSWYRACLLARTTRNRYLQSKNSVLTIQCAARGLFVLSEYERCMVRVLQLQALCRRSLVRRTVDRQIRAATIMQQFARRRIIGRELSDGRRLRAEFVRKQASALRIQATFRAYVQRKRFLLQSPIRRNPQQIRERLPMLPRLPGPEQSIAGRLSTALAVIQQQVVDKNYKLSILWRFLMEVEMACRLSQESCEFLLVHDSFIENLYDILSASNLGPAWLEVVYAIVQVLRNLATSQVQDAAARLTRSDLWTDYFSRHIQSLAQQPNMFIDTCVFLAAIHTLDRVVTQMAEEQFIYGLGQTRAYILKSRTFKDKDMVYKVATQEGSSQASKVERLTKLWRAKKLKQIEHDVLYGNPIVFRPGWSLNRKLPTAKDLDSEQNAFNYIIRLYKLTKIQPIV